MKEGEENCRNPRTVTEVRRGKEEMVGARSARRLKFGWLSRVVCLLVGPVLFVSSFSVARPCCTWLREEGALVEGARWEREVAVGERRKDGG